MSDQSKTEDRQTSSEYLKKITEDMYARNNIPEGQRPVIEVGDLESGGLYDKRTQKITIDDKYIKNLSRKMVAT